MRLGKYGPEGQKKKMAISGQIEPCELNRRDPNAYGGTPFRGYPPFMAPPIQGETPSYARKLGVITQRAEEKVFPLIITKYPYSPDSLRDIIKKYIP